MKPSRIAALVIGCLLLLPGLALLFGGGALGVAYAAGRNDAGYFEVTIASLRSASEAITAETPALTDNLQTSTWLLDSLDTDLRVRITAPSSDTPIFAGIGPTTAVDTYLNGVAHDQITGLGNRGVPLYRTIPGTVSVTPPAEQVFWASTTAGSPELTWSPANGQWSVVVMNADGSPGIDAAATIEIKAGFLLPLALILLVVGTLITAGAIAAMVIGARGRNAVKRNQVVPPASGSLTPVNLAATAEHPVVLTAHLDPGLSRWQWLVKWFLAIPHYIVLAFLWPAFVIVTIIAGFGILLTGHYPRSLFDFTSGVLRWSWRVSYYAANGGLGTDQYPPFTLGHAPDYPATLDIAYPAGLSRGLVLVKWWLLAIPHYLIIGFFVSNWWGWNAAGESFALGPVGSGGLFGLLIFVTAVILLFTGTYPAQLFALIIGGNRWIYRVIAYAALMTDQYPPFRLDQGGSEPTTPPGPPTAGPAAPPLPEAATVG